MQTQTGSYIALAGFIVAVLAHFGVITDTNSVVLVIGGAVSLYGIIHQFFVTKTVVTAARQAGVKGI